MSDQGQPSRLRALATRWLGVGLAAVVSVVILVLAALGQLHLYISPESVWFAVSAAVVTLAGAVWSCALPLGTEDHDHDDDHDLAENTGRRSSRRFRLPAPVRRGAAVTATAIGGVIATVVVGAALILPPASLSVELAMSRASSSDGALFQSADRVVLGVADTSAFGVGDWATVFRTATRPEGYDGTPVQLSGFVTPSGEDPDELGLTRMVITHCVIDAQPASVPVELIAWAGELTVGEWVEIDGTIRVGDDGTLRVEPAIVAPIPEPGDPYEY